VWRPQPLAAGGWWRSGDGGRLGPGGLEIRGRLDGAISSGGETVFPDQVEQLLRGWARRDGLALGELLLLPRPDPVWGERLVGLYRPSGPATPKQGNAAARAERLGQGLRRLSRELPPSQRPVQWIHCSALERDGLDKWQRGHWLGWLGRRSGPG
jgi:o-succinylbenzoate---CoA ligase